MQGDSTRLLENDYSTQQTKENECCSCPEGEKCCIGWKRDVIFFISGLFFTLAVGGLGFFIYLKVDGSSCKHGSFVFFLEHPQEEIDVVFSSLFFFLLSKDHEKVN